MANEDGWEIDLGGRPTLAVTARNQDFSLNVYISARPIIDLSNGNLDRNPMPSKSSVG